MDTLLRHVGKIFSNLIEGWIVQILTLSFGFSILVYSFLLVLGYGTKKKILIDKCLTDDCLKKELKTKIYARTRFMGEAILILLGISYLFTFLLIKDWAILIPFIIVLIFGLICVISNLLSLNKV